MIQRIQHNRILARLNKGKIILLLGPRQVGKTTLLKRIASELSGVLWLNADLAEVQLLWDSHSKQRLGSIIGNHSIVIIDEAQNISKIGHKLKIIIDEFNHVQLLATGSSSFELADKMSEPLTGRKYMLRLYPISFEEMVQYHGFMEETGRLEQRLVFGYYPDIVMHPGEEVELLKQLSSSYLYRDVLMYGNIKKPNKILQLLQALAFQVGGEVSYTSLGKMLRMDNETIDRYIDLLEKSFVIYRLGALNRNLRSEIKRGKKIYFYDNGIRNALINQFNPLNLRNDIGALWENFIISERLKYLEYHGIYAQRYFWRTHNRNELDYIEDINGQLYAYEIKWNPKRKTRIPKAFAEAYPEAKFKVINPQNLETFLLPGSHA